MLKKAQKLIQDIYPDSWLAQLEKPGQKIDVIQFRNLQHFKTYMKDEVKPDPEGSSHSQPTPYPQALDDMLKGVPVFDTSKFESIKAEVKSVLHKRGLLSENVYEGYQYDVEGDIIDIPKYIAGDPECMLKPKIAYENHFYELYISAAYLSGVSLTTVAENAAKILATVQLLEQERIYIKVNIVMTSSDLIEGDTLLAIFIPLFSHRDEKTIDIMSSVLNDRLFRTLIFGMKEHIYGEDLYEGYGRTIDMKEAINLHTLDVVELAESILEKTITPGTR